LLLAVANRQINLHQGPTKWYALMSF